MRKSKLLLKVKKINSIHYGGKVMVIGIIFAFVIPLAVSFFDKIEFLQYLSKISFFAGVSIFLFFGIWLMIELRQDKLLNDYYKENQNKIITIRDNLYECQNCGNRDVKLTDTKCCICGIKFEGSDLNEKI